ncbi:MAG TPA: M24 family metallopeptidase [Acidimicrobiales bacterium]|nr:M24 family metallopeptidase [Acidimicrobiales bacterium]
MVITAGPGVAALPEGGRVDFARLRRERRARLLEAMAEAGLDALVLGRPANITYASGARQLWTAGARPFGPGAVVMADSGEVHLLSTWDDGVPSEIGRDHLFGLSWNPGRIVANLAAIPGLASAPRIGTDGWSPGAGALVAAVAAGAEFIDAWPALAAARRVKTVDELACLRTAAAAAEAGMSALVEALRPGITERQLMGVHAAALARLGLPTPPIEAAASLMPGADGKPTALRRLVSDQAAEAGQMVALTAGALYAGYEATLSRTWLVGSEPGALGTASAGQRGIAGQARALRDARVAACRPGPLPASLGPDQSAGAEPVAWGVGLGMEAPLLGAGLGTGTELSAGMTLVVQAWAAGLSGPGGALEADLVLVGPEGPESLTRFGSCPALTAD